MSRFLHFPAFEREERARAAREEQQRLERERIEKEKREKAVREIKKTRDDFFQTVSQSSNPQPALKEFLKNHPDFLSYQDTDGSSLLFVAVMKMRLLGPDEARGDAHDAHLRGPFDSE